MSFTRPALDGQRSVSSAVNQGDDILSTIKPFLKRLEEAHALQSSSPSSFDSLEANVKALRETIHTINGQVESLSNSLSSSYHTTVTVSSQVEHSAYDAYLASLGLLGAVTSDDLETIRYAFEFSQRLEKLQSSITSVSELQEKQSEPIESYFTVDNMGNATLDRTKLREKIDLLQKTMELVFQRLAWQQAVLSPAKTNHAKSTPTPSQDRRRSGGRTLRFIDEDEVEENNQPKMVGKALFPRSHSGDQDQQLSWLETTLDAPQLSPLPSPSQLHSKHYFPPSVMSRPVFLASKRRNSWQNVAKTLHHQLERPCLSFALYDTLTSTTAQLANTNHPSSDQYNLARRKFAAVKATHWTDHVSSSSLNDQTLVGDLANLLSQSLHVQPQHHQSPVSTKLIQEANKPFSPLQTKQPVTIIPQIQQPTTPNTTSRMATLRANIDAFTEKKIVYTYKVKPPPPPPAAPPVAPPVAPPSEAAPPQPVPPTVSTPAVAPAKPATESLSFTSKLTPLSSKPKTIEEEIRSLYEKYNPSKINDIPGLLEKNKGKEQALLEKIRKKYEPDGATGTTSSTNNVPSSSNPFGLGAAPTTTAAPPVTTKGFGVATTPTTMGNAKKPMTVEEEIRALYEKYNPDKIAEVPALLLKYQGSEQALLERIRKKYEPNGPTTSVANTANTTPLSTTGTSLFSATNLNAANKTTTPVATTTNWLQPKSANPTPFSSSTPSATTPATTAASATKSVFQTSQGTTPFSSGTGANNGFLNMGATTTPAGGSTTGGATSLFTPAKSPATNTTNTLFATPTTPFGTKPSSLFANQASPAAPSFGAGWGGATQQQQPQGQPHHAHNASIQAQIEDIYRQHNPTKLAEVPDLLLKYSGRELELLQKMQKKYLSAAGTPGAIPGISNSVFQSQTTTPVNRSVFASPMANTINSFSSGGVGMGVGLGGFGASSMPQSAATTPFGSSNANANPMGGGITFGGGFGSSPAVGTSLFKR